MAIASLRLSAPLRGAGDGPPVYLPGAVPSGPAEDPAVSGPDGPDVCGWASPPGCRALIFSASNVMIQSAINSFGSVVMAGSSAASGIENFIHTALNTFYQSAITFTGQSIGASDPRRAVRVFRINLALTTGLGIVLCALAQIFQIPLLGLYVQSTDPAYDAVIAAGVVRVLALSRFQWVGGLMETACGTLPGSGPLHESHRHHPHWRVSAASGLAVHRVRGGGHRGEHVLVLSGQLAPDFPDPFDLSGA